MKFFILIIIVTLGFSISGLAQDESGSTYELSVQPIFGYSSSNGLALGSDLGLAFRISGRWQLTTDASYYGYMATGVNAANFLVGTQYNFSDDIQSAKFLGFGAGLNRPPDGEARPLVYVRGGWRNQISERLAINWSPAIQVTYYANRDDYNGIRFSIGLEILRFTKYF